jgi:hypothetical protein
MRTGWILLALPLLAGSTSERPPREAGAKKFRLELHVPDQGGIYFSAWDGDPVIADHDASDGKTVTYRRRYVWGDRCTWEATETLVPTARDRYAYTYRERPQSCPTGAIADTEATTPRDGNVTVHPTNLTKPNTPLVAWARGWEQRQ